MKKSIYYLIANVVSIIAAYIFLAIVGNKYPLFDLSLVVTSLKDTFTSFIFALPVLALSIIVTTRECVLNEAKPSTLSKVLLFITAIGTILSIGFTWFSAILVVEGYAINMTVSLPLIYLISYVVGILLLYVAPIISKKNQNAGISLVIIALSLIIAGITYDCIEKANLIVAICVGASLFVVPTLITLITSLVSKKKN